MAITLDEDQGSACLYVKVNPGSRVEHISGEHDGMLKISVTTAPEKGKANKTVLKILSKSLGVAKSSMKIISGETSGKKRIKIEGMNVEELSARISDIVKGD